MADAFNDSGTGAPAGRAGGERRGTAALQQGEFPTFFWRRIGARAIFSPPRNDPGACKCRRRTWLAAVLTVVLAGCGTQEIDRTYGKRRGAEGEASVNGTAVLARMFELAGHEVRTRSYLSPRAEEFDVIVWFPDDFQPPGEEPQEFLEEWLYGGRGRTLIYVGRDYDAAIDYWESMMTGAPPEQSVEILRRLARARAEHARARAVMPEAAECRWFQVRRGGTPRGAGRRGETPAMLQGPWADAGPFRSSALAGGDVVSLEPRKEPVLDDFDERLDTEIWLSADRVPLVWRVSSSSWDEGQIIVIHNGSFLLNLPLVEHEHRKLAGKLIDACGSAPKKVMFLESEAPGVTIFEEEPGTKYPTGFEAFTVWPLNAILLHFIVLGLTILACRWTVFGRPRELPRPPVSDFGRHVEALGELLARTQDHAYAESRLAEYHRQTATDRPLSESPRAETPRASGGE